VGFVSQTKGSVVGPQMQLCWPGLGRSPCIPARSPPLVLSSIGTLSPTLEEGCDRVCGSHSAEYGQLGEVDHAYGNADALGVGEPPAMRGCQQSRADCQLAAEGVVGTIQSAEGGGPLQ